jgi:TRAP-type C4-dicarboxylate transport system substrate-binding protein
MKRLLSRCGGIGLAAWMALGVLGACVPAAWAQSAPSAPTHLRIVGGLAGLNQYRRHEEPFWTSELPRLSGGRASAEIVPFDRAGIRGQEVLRLVQLGAVPFGTALLTLSAAQDPELMAPDLAGLNPDMATLRRSVAAFRPYLEATLRERYGAELLALYVYPAQATFCTKPLGSLADLAGRRVRVSSATQGDWAAALGATPVTTSFAEMLAQVRSGNIDCAITGTMSGNTIGLHEATSHLHTMAVNWGLAAFVANGAAWSALPAELQALLKRELPRVERAVWTESADETGEGIACNTGAAGCTNGRKGRMVEVKESADDARRRRDILVGKVLPAWLQRCGPSCRTVWRQTIGPALGIEAP